MRSRPILLRFFGGAICVGSLSVAHAKLFAAPFQPDDWSAFEREAPSSQSADVDLADQSNAMRIRIPLSLKGFERVPAVSTGAASKDTRDVIVARRPQQFNLKARLDRLNHFYFGDWHIETTPMGKTAMGEVIMKLSLSRTYGDGHELEEHVGDLNVQGGLTRIEPGLYGFMGKAGARFTGRSGDLMAEIQVNGGQSGDYVSGKVSRLDPPAGVKPLVTSPAR